MSTGTVVVAVVFDVGIAAHLPRPRISCGSGLGGHVVTPTCPLSRGSQAC